MQRFCFDFSDVIHTSSNLALYRISSFPKCLYQLDRTALHCAAAAGHVAVTEALIEGGADLEAKDKVGLS